VGSVVHGTSSLSERDYAVTPILLILSIVAASVATVRERRTTAGTDRRYSSAVLAATGIVLLLLPMAVGGTFLWRAVYWIPGASGIRAVDRISVVACGVFALALVDAGAHLYPWLRAAMPGSALIAGFSLLALVLCLEQVNVSDTSLMHRRAQLALLDAAGAPPPSCKSFFVETTTASAAHPAQVQTTAMLVSAKYDVPTLNGTSGSFPKGWFLFYPMRLVPFPYHGGKYPGYLTGVKDWIRAKHLTGTVCELNLDASRWSTYRAAR
jgi:hypothetical protein